MNNRTTPLCSQPLTSLACRSRMQCPTRPMPSSLDSCRATRLLVPNRSSSPTPSVSWTKSLSGSTAPKDSIARRVWLAPSMRKLTAFISLPSMSTHEVSSPETGNKTVEAFTNLARAATENLSPGQVAGQGNASPGGSASPSGEAAPGGGSGGSGAGGAGGAGASPTSPSPAQQSTSAASGRLFDACRQTLLTLGMGTMVAFLVL